MKYIVSSKRPNSHYLDIELHVDNIEEEKLMLQLPAWRPGRYQLGNFAANIREWEAFGPEGEKLESEKVSKDKWQVHTKDVSKIVVKYNFYSNKIDAGSTYVDDKQVYINGVNCFLYVPERIHQECELKLDFNPRWDVATGLPETGEMLFKAGDFHELVDSPLIAAPEIKKKSYQCNDVKFNVWMHGECKPEWDKLLNDFKAFTEQQLKDIGKFPVDEYHFIFFILPYKTYHGVEHVNSTVIVLGPSYDVMRKDGWYNELLGVSSHELFHTWNVKQIRPVEMYPYEYSKENYTKLGYISEGLTTYYGDVFLHRSGVYSREDYFNRFNKLLQRHYYNLGTRNLSVAESSFDTWLDGYQAGVPGRKASIYIEGALCAFMTDVFIRKATGNESSLDDVVTLLYEDYACKGKGVSEADYKKTVEEVSGKDFTYIHQNYIHGSEDYTPELEKALDYLGLKLMVSPSSKISESVYGFRLTENEEGSFIADIYPGSPAEESGLSYNDEIIAVNGFKVNADVEKWMNYFEEESMELTIKREHGAIGELILQKGEEVYYKNYEVTVMESPSNDQEKAFMAWMG